MEKETETIRTSLRIPRPLYDMLHEAAQKRGMTMHAEMLDRLESSFAGVPTSVELIEEVAQRVIDRLMVSPHMQPALELLRERLKQE